MEDHVAVYDNSPVGLHPNVDEAPQLPYSAIGDRHVLIDLVYNPERSQFLQEGEARGAVVANGMAMLVGQAEASWKIWKGEEQ